MIVGSIEKLEWDSNFFEKRIGRYTIDYENEFDPIIFNKEVRKYYDLVYVISNYKLLPSCKILAANLDLIDIVLTMSMPFVKDLYSDMKYDFRTSLTEKEIADCYKIAEQTSIVSRFNIEPLIGRERTKALYRKWIDNAINQSFSDGLFLEKINNKVVGIHLIRTINENNTGLCTLIGVDADYKRMGIGRRLWNQSFAYWANIGGLKTIKVPFSLQNKESLNFHIKMGFKKVEETRYIYHFRTL